MEKSVEIAAEARRGVVWAGASVGISTLAGLVQIAVAARFLVREDFGAMAMMLVLIGLAQQLGDLGTANALLHRQRSTPAELDALFWMGGAVGLALWAVVAGGALLAARLWDGWPTSAWLPLAGLVFPFDGLGQVHLLLLRRALRFRAIAAVDLAAAGAGLVAVCALAVGGAGLLALVAGLIATSAVRSAGAALLARDLFAPSFRFSRRDLAPYLGFGLFQLGERVVNYVAWNLDKAVIGASLGAEALGVYSLAYQLMMRPFRLLATVTTKVTRPLLARLQEDRPRLLEGYLTSVRLVALVALPLYVGAFLTADLLIALVYGPGWGDVTDVFRILWPLGALYSIGNPVGALVVATGKARVGLLWNVFAVLVHLVAVATGIRFGVQGVASAVVAATLFVLFPGGFYLRWVLVGLTARPFLSALVAPLAYAAAMAGAVTLLVPLIESRAAGFQLAACAIAGGAVYSALLVTRERTLLLSLRRP